MLVVSGGGVHKAAKYKKNLELERVHDFLGGLNCQPDEVRGRLLGTKPLPAIEEIFTEVRREGSRKRIMLGDSKTMQNEESLAMAARGSTLEHEGEAMVARGNGSRGDF